MGQLRPHVLEFGFAVNKLIPQFGGFCRMLIHFCLEGIDRLLALLKIRLQRRHPRIRLLHGSL